MRPSTPFPPLTPSVTEVMRLSGLPREVVEKHLRKNLYDRIEAASADTFSQMLGINPAGAGTWHYARPLPRPSLWDKFLVWWHSLWASPADTAPVFVPTPPTRFLASPPHTLPYRNSKYSTSAPKTTPRQFGVDRA